MLHMWISCVFVGFLNTRFCISSNDESITKAFPQKKASEICFLIVCDDFRLTLAVCMAHFHTDCFMNLSCIAAQHKGIYWWTKSHWAGNLTTACEHWYAVKFRVLFKTAISKRASGILSLANMFAFLVWFSWFKKGGKKKKMLIYSYVCLFFTKYSTVQYVFHFHC